MPETTENVAVFRIHKSSSIYRYDNSAIDAALDREPIATATVYRAVDRARLRIDDSVTIHVIATGEQPTVNLMRPVMLLAHAPSNSPLLPAGCLNRNLDDRFQRYQLRAISLHDSVVQIRRLFRANRDHKGVTNLVGFLRRLALLSCVVVDIEGGVFERSS